MNESREQSGPPEECGHDPEKQGAAQPARHMRRQGDGHHHGRGRRWPRAEVAERLLQGEDVTDADPRSAEVAGLLAAARVLPPGRPQDEEAALDAFRRSAAGGAPTAPPRVPVPVVRGGRWRTAHAHHPVRMLVGGAVAVLALSSVAIAAQGGALPHPFHPSGGTTHSPSASASSPSAGDTGTAPGLPRSPGTTRGSGMPRTPSANPRPSATAAPASPAPGVSADAGTKGLCEAYAKAERAGRTPDGTVQARLAKAAGSTAGIDAYCAGLTAVPGHDHDQKGTEWHAGPSPSAPAAPAASAAPKAAAPVTPSGRRRK